MIPKRNIALIGFMAAGKTSVGLALSALTKIPFVDIDLLVEESEGMSIAEIFATRGEGYFREVEGAVFRGLCEGAGRILGCGGGTLIDPRNRVALMDGCRAVWLRVSAEEVLDRISRPDAPARPLIDGSPRLIVPRLLQSRETLYGIADLTVDTAGRGIEEIAEGIRVALSLPLATKG